jgi:hypothetical protein
MNNLIFQMAIPFLTQPPLTGRGSRVYPNVGAAGCTLVGAAGCTLTSGQPGVPYRRGSRVRGRRCDRASPSRLGLRPSRLALRARARLVVWIRTIICIIKCTNWYKNHTVYEFVLNNLYNNCMNSFVWICTKISEKKETRLGFQPGTNMACNRRNHQTTRPIFLTPITTLQKLRDRIQSQLPVARVC